MPLALESFVNRKLAKQRDWKRIGTVSLISLRKKRPLNLRGTQRDKANDLL